MYLYKKYFKMKNYKTKKVYRTTTKLIEKMQQCYIFSLSINTFSQQEQSLFKMYIGGKITCNYILNKIFV